MAVNFFQNIRVYWLAFIAYWGILLFGYDTGIAGGVVSQAYFQTHFHMRNADGSINKSRNDAVSSNVVAVLQAGAFFGALASPFLSSRWGRKWTMIVFIGIFSIGAILTTVASGPNNLIMIYLGRVISGLGIGAVSAVAPAYVAECSPKDVRGRITGLFQVMVAAGVMVSYFINYGIGINTKLANSSSVWTIPFGFQLVPAGIMLFGLFTLPESPRFLASIPNSPKHTLLALKNLAYLRKLPETDPSVLEEMAEIEAVIAEEKAAREGLDWKEAFLGKGNRSRFVIAFLIFFLQQWAGQNSVGYYAPQIFSSIGYIGPKNSLLASGVYGVVKLVATAIFIAFGVDSLGRRISLFISAMGMGTLFFIVGAILKTHPTHTPPPGTTIDPPPASKAMAAMLYVYVCFYSMGWGPLPWVYCADIFPTRTRHYGLALASATQWLFNFVVAKVTPTLETKLGYKLFFMFASINIGAMAVFSLLIPETKGKSLEEMDVLFGSITAEQREIDKQEKLNAIGTDVSEKGWVDDKTSDKTSEEKV